jgi:hypothetical protein
MDGLRGAKFNSIKKYPRSLILIFIGQKQDLLKIFLRQL